MPQILITTVGYDSTSVGVREIKCVIVEFMHDAQAIEACDSINQQTTFYNVKQKATPLFKQPKGN